MYIVELHENGTMNLTEIVLRWERRADGEWGS
jgi:hypothetical protein